MKIWVVYRWDHWDRTEYDRRYFLNQEKATQYYENNKESYPYGIWNLDEIEVED